MFSNFCWLLRPLSISWASSCTQSPSCYDMRSPGISVSSSDLWLKYGEYMPLIQYGLISKSQLYSQGYSPVLRVKNSTYHSSWQTKSTHVYTHIQRTSLHGKSVEKLISKIRNHKENVNWNHNTVIFQHHVWWFKFLKSDRIGSQRVAVLGGIALSQ